MAATAFVLAAGLGTRLRPLTLSTPKPLLPVRGVPMLDRALALLRAHGHTEVVVNAHWLAEQVVAWGRGRPGVTVVVESPTILGTGGGLRHARAHLAERFVVLNGDILTDVDLTALWHEPAEAVLALRPQAEPRHTGIALDTDGVVTGIQNVVGLGDPRLHFTGVHVLDRALLDLVPDGEQCIIRTVYKALVPQRRVRGTEAAIPRHRAPPARPPLDAASGRGGCLSGLALRARCGAHAPHTPGRRPLSQVGSLSSRPGAPPAPLAHQTSPTRPTGSSEGRPRSPSN